MILKQEDTQNKTSLYIFKEKIYYLINFEKGSWFGFFYDLTIATIAIISILPLITNPATQGPFLQEVSNLHYPILSIFIFDYLLRWFLADVKYKQGLKSFLLYPLSLWAIIDLVAIVPSLIGIEIMQAFIALRLLRLTRLFPKMEKGFLFIFRCIFAYWRVLMIIIISYFTMIFMGGIFMYVFEEGKNPHINSYFDAVWCIFISVSTIGFGDVYPVTDMGRILIIIFYFIGVGFLALVTATIVAGFKLEVHNFRKDLEMEYFVHHNSKYYLKIFRKKVKSKRIMNKEPYYNLSEKYENLHEYLDLSKKE